MTRQTDDVDTEHRDERGAGSPVKDGGPGAHRARLLEFAVILTLIVVVAVVALVLLDDALADLMLVVGESVE